MHAIVKVTCDGEVRHVRVEGSRDYAAVIDAIKRAYPDADDTYVAKYYDEDGDLCTLMEYTFVDFLMCASEKSDGEPVPETTILHVVLVRPFTASALPDELQIQASGIQASRAMNQTSAASHPKGNAVGGKRKPPVPTKPVWKEDNRDLEELVRQLDDSPAGPPVKATREKRKQKKHEASPADPPRSSNASMPTEERDASDSGKAKELPSEHSSPPPTPQLWPSTPESTPPQSPRQPDTEGVCGASSSFTSAQGIVCWVPMWVPLLQLVT